MKRKKRATIDYTGRRFSRWTVIRFSPQSTTECRKWVCKCQCGTVKHVQINNLTTGTSKSCGCLNMERIHEKGRNRVHGLVGTKTYKTWDSMKQRCLNRHNKDFSNYGGRGIKICELVLSSPAVIVALIGRRPDGNYSIDRKDNNGNYSCGSCGECLENGWKMNLKWSNSVEQGRNRRTNQLVSINGTTKTLAEWSELSKIKKTTIHRRFHRGEIGPALIAALHPGRRLPENFKTVLVP